VFKHERRGTDLYSTVQVPNDGQYHEIAGSYDGAMMRVFLDGALVGQKPHSGPIEITTEAPAIGAEVGCNQLAYADIDEVRLFSDAGFALTGSNVFNGNQTVNGSVRASALSGDGSALTNLSPANMSAGSASINITGTAAAATNANNSSNLNGVPGTSYARLDVNNSFTGNESIAGTLSIGGGNSIRQYRSATFPVTVAALAPTSCDPVRLIVINGLVNDGDTLVLGVANSLINPAMTGAGVLNYRAWINGQAIALQVCNLNPNGPKSNAVSGMLTFDVWKH
jgi:hypothetical protein